jgi:hypothetical protein
MSPAKKNPEDSFLNIYTHTCGTKQNGKQKNSGVDKSFDENLVSTENKSITPP